MLLSKIHFQKQVMPVHEWTGSNKYVFFNDCQWNESSAPLWPFIDWVLFSVRCWADGGPLIRLQELGYSMDSSKPETWKQEISSAFGECLSHTIADSGMLWILLFYYKLCIAIRWLFILFFASFSVLFCYFGKTLRQLTLFCVLAALCFPFALFLSFLLGYYSRLSPNSFSMQKWHSLLLLTLSCLSVSSPASSNVSTLGQVWSINVSVLFQLFSLNVQNLTSPTSPLSAVSNN